MAKGKVIKEEVVPEEKLNPSDSMAIEDSEKKRAPGNWIKASNEELVKYEKAGTLIGHDPKTGHVLLKEEE